MVSGSGGVIGVTETELDRFTEKTRSKLQKGENVTVVAFGDSITFGFAVSKGFTSFWMEMLKEKYPLTEVRMINKGICGDTSLNGVSRLEWSVISNEPDLVTINFGINDMYMGLGLNQFKGNLIGMVDRILDEVGCEVLLLSSEPLLTPSFDERILDYYTVLEQVAEEMDVGFVDVYGAWMRAVEKSEGVTLESLILPGLDHPNEAGYRVIAKELMRFF